LAQARAAKALRPGCGARHRQATAAALNYSTRVDRRAPVQGSLLLPPLLRLRQRQRQQQQRQS
jgi:hypothetical protein